MARQREECVWFSLTCSKLDWIADPVQDCKTGGRGCCRCPDFQWKLQDHRPGYTEAFWHRCRGKSTTDAQKKSGDLTASAVY